MSSRSRWTHSEESGIQTSGMVTSGLASVASAVDELDVRTTTVGQAPSTTGLPLIQCEATSLTVGAIAGAARTVSATPEVHDRLDEAAEGDVPDWLTSTATTLRTADLPLFRRSLVPAELPGPARRVSVYRTPGEHIGRSRGQRRARRSSAAQPLVVALPGPARATAGWRADRAAATRDAGRWPAR